MSDETYLWLVHHKALVETGVGLLLIAALVIGWLWGRRVERAEWHRMIQAAAARGPKVQDPALVAAVEGAGVTISDKEPSARPPAGVRRGVS